MLIDMHSQVVRLSGRKYHDDEAVLQILKSAAQDGITHIIATPLYQKERYRSKEIVIENEVDKLNEKLSELEIPLTIFEGMEIVLYEKVADDIKLNLLPLAGSNKYVFIRFQDHQLPVFGLSVFFQMQLMGYIPIIANVEQNHYFAKNPSKLLEYIKKGALVHVGAASILGLNGKLMRKRAFRLCRQNLVHLVSSASIQYESRPSYLKPAYEQIRNTFSDAYLEYFIKNAENVVSGVDFHTHSQLRLNNFKKMFLR